MVAICIFNDSYLYSGNQYEFAAKNYKCTYLIFCNKKEAKKSSKRRKSEWSVTQRALNGANIMCKCAIV